MIIMWKQMQWKVHFVGMNHAIQTLVGIKTGKVVGHSVISMELIAASGDVEIQVMVELCQIILDILGMLAFWIWSAFEGP